MIERSGKFSKESFDGISFTLEDINIPQSLPGKYPRFSYMNGEEVEDTNFFFGYPF